MALALGVPIDIGVTGGSRIATVDSQRIIMVSNGVRIVNVITREVGSSSVYEADTPSAVDVINLEEGRALIVYAIPFGGTDPGKYCKIVNYSGITITGFGSRVQLDSNSSLDNITVTLIDTRKTVTIYNGRTSGQNSIDSRVITTSGLIATPATVEVLHTGTATRFAMDALSPTGVAMTYRGAPGAPVGINAKVLSITGNLVSISDEKKMDDLAGAGNTDFGRHLSVTDNNIFAITYKTSAIDKTVAGIVASGIIGVGVPINTGGAMIETLPGNKFVTIEQINITGEINQISVVNAVLTDNNVPFVFGEDSGFSITKVGNCVAITYTDVSSDRFVVMLTERAQFYQGSGPFGGAGRMLKTADLQIPGVRPNAIDVSGSGLAVLGANAGAPCQEADVVISAVAPYASWDNQSKNYPTGSAVTSVKFV